MTDFSPNFETLSASIEGERAEQFRLFQDLILSYNQSFNLTSLVDEREIAVKHFLDSLAGEKLFSSGATVAEVGSGAGFPSVPLRILREDLSFTLFESTGKKCEFLRVVSDRLGLGMQVNHMRAEDAGKDALFREQFDYCCARAVARLNTLAEYCLPLVKVGGRFLAYKGACEEEIAEAKRALSVLGGEVERVVKFSLPEGFGERCIVVVKKIKPTPSKYPRGRGKERREPLS